MSKELRRALVILFPLAVVPLIFFPNRFGLDYASWVGPQLLAGEAVFYFLVFFWIFPEAELFKKFGYTLGTLTYRLLAGTLLGLFLATSRSLPVKNGLEQGWYGYFPGFLFASVLAPFILKGLWGNRQDRKVHPRGSYEPSVRSEAASAGPIRSRSETGRPKPETSGSPSRRDLREINFDDALAYIGEQKGVEKAYLVDEEGLVLARFESGGAWEDELWAAWGLVLAQKNKELLSGLGSPELKALELSLSSGKVYVQKVLDFYLIAVVEAQADELLNVRLVRASEMIRRHWQDKYEAVLKTNREGAYVPDLRGA